MIFAVSVWNNRIAPVFDICSCIKIIEVSKGELVKIDELIFDDQNPQHKISMISQIGVNALVCGAISKELDIYALSCGIKVYSFMRGNFEKICKSLTTENFCWNNKMPGCRGHRNQRCCKRS